MWKAGGGVEATALVRGFVQAEDGGGAGKEGVGREGGDGLGGGGVWSAGTREASLGEGVIVAIHSSIF